MLAERIALVVSSTITQIVFARNLGHEIFGQISAILAASSLLLPIAQGGLSSVVVKLAVEHPRDEQKIFETAIWWRLASSIVGLSIGTLAWLGSITPGDSFAFLLLIASQLLLAFQVLEFRFLAHSELSSLVIARVAVSLFFAVLKIAAAIESANVATIAGLFALENAALGLTHAVANKFNFGRWALPVGHVGWKTLYWQSSPWLIASALAESINQKIDIIMLERLHGAGEAGVYAAASKVSEAWFSIPYLIAAAYFPAILRTREAGNIPQDSWQRLLDRMLTLTLAVTLGLTLLAPLVIESLYGAAYAPSAGVLAIHLWAGLFVGMRAILSRWIVAEDLLHISLLTAASGAVVNVALNLVLIPRLGATGAAFATVASYATAAWLSLFFTAKTRPMAVAMSRSLLFPLRLRGFWRNLGAAS